MSRFCWLRIFNPARIQIFSSYSKYSPKISQIFPIPSSLHPQKRTTQRQRQRGNVEPWGVDFTLRGGYGWSIQFLCGCIIQHRGTKKKMISWKMEMVGGKWLATLKLEASGMFHCREMGVLCLHRLGKILIQAVLLKCFWDDLGSFLVGG